MAMGFSTRLDRQVDDLCENFVTYLDKFNELAGKPPFTKRAGDLHVATIDLRKDLGGTAKSIDSDEYMRSLYDTLEAWGMNKLGAKMQERPVFAERIRKYKTRIVALDGVGAAQIDAGIARELWRIIQGMQLSQKKPSQTVTGAKALHHLLPQLLPPIDRGYTRPFFRYHTSTFQNNQERAFKMMLPYFARIARQVDSGRYVGTARWATSESKVIDNAIIGFCKLHIGQQSKYHGSGTIGGYGVEEAAAHITRCGWCREALGS